jgi:hypothetical protein
MKAVKALRVARAGWCRGCVVSSLTSAVPVAAIGGAPDIQISQQDSLSRKTAGRSETSPPAGLLKVSQRMREQLMRILRNVMLIGALAAVCAVPVMGQVHKYFSPGTVWTVTMIQMAPGMDQMYLQYLDTSFKKSEDAQVKAGFQKSYKILRTLDDSGTWNLLILREYTSLASVEANVEKADALLQQSDGTDEAQMKGYQDRSKYREVVGTKYARELILK